MIHVSSFRRSLKLNGMFHLRVSGFIQSRSRIKYDFILYVSFLYESIENFNGYCQKSVESLIQKLTDPSYTKVHMIRMTLLKR